MNVQYINIIYLLFTYISATKVVLLLDAFFFYCSIVTVWSFGVWRWTFWWIKSSWGITISIHRCEHCILASQSFKFESILTVYHSACKTTENSQKAIPEFCVHPAINERVIHTVTHCKPMACHPNIIHTSNIIYSNVYGSNKVDNVQGKPTNGINHNNSNHHLYNLKIYYEILTKCKSNNRL